jgi:hypothetical protein
MANLTTYQAKLVNSSAAKVKILAGQTESDVFNASGASVLAFATSENFTTSDVTFLASLDSVNFYPLWDGYSNTQVSMPAVEASKFIKIFPADFAGVQALKLVSSVAQLEDTEIQISSGPILGN